MKQQKQAKPLNNTQIKLVLAKMVDTFNKQVSAADDKREKRRRMAINKYYTLMEEQLNRAFTSDLAAKLCRKLRQSHIHEEDGELSLKAVTGEDVPKLVGNYTPDRWSAKDHPLDPIYKEMQFKLHMATAENYEKYMKEFEAACNRIHK